MDFKSYDFVEINSDEIGPEDDILSKMSFGDVRMPYGFFLREEDGQRFLVPASLEVYVAAEEARTGKTFDKDALGPQILPSCRQESPTGCLGSCYAGTFCKRLYNPKEQYYYCACA